MASKYALGLMSGTSCDGVSLALCSFSPQNFKIHHHATYPYPPALLQPLTRALQLSTPGISKLNFALGIFFADCAEKFLRKHRVPFSKIAVIGSHGQTIYHGPKDRPRNTLQIGEPSFLAERIGAPVVADFRPRDIAAGGSGAPLIPFFDAAFLGHGKNIALQNIGGIGNITFLPGILRSAQDDKQKGQDDGGMLAFDTGPGNCLIDLAVQEMTRGRWKFDRDGKIAAQGRIDAPAVQKMLRHPFFRERPPKSTGRELFNRKFIQTHLRALNPKDKIATLTFLTAFTIFESSRRFLPNPISKLIVSGGGSKNRTLMRHLQKLFYPVPVQSIETLGVPAQAKEPAAFAFFAWQALRGKINHAPQGTGAKRVCVLGKIIP